MTRSLEYASCFTMACGLLDDMPCLQPFPKAVLTYVSVCQARTLTHANHEPSMRTERRALQCPVVRHAPHEYFPRHERALHSSAARSGHLRKVVPTLGGFVCSQCLLGLGAHTRGHRRISDDTLALASAPGFGVSADTHGLTDALVSTDAARRDDACPDAAGLLSLLDASKPSLACSCSCS